MKPRTLLIGLDGATFDLIRPWSQAGCLPNLTRLMQEGAHGPLKAWPNLNSAAAWSSIVTGVNPGRHGIYDFGTNAPQKGYRWQPSTALQRKADPFWRYLSAAGQCVGVINVPISYPADPINGFMLSGMDAPGVNSRGFSHPPGLYADLRSAGIDYTIDVAQLQEASRRNRFELPVDARKLVDTRANTILLLMQRFPWDALMAVFVATDRMQHYFWSNEPIAADSPGWAAVLSLYRLIDAQLGRLLEQTDENTTVIIISDHGFGPSRATQSTRGRLNRMFADLGLLKFRQGRRRWSGSLLKNLLVLGRRHIPMPWQLPLAQALPGLRLRAVSEYKYAALNWAETLAFAEPNDNRVHINLKGRNAEGVVPPEEYEQVRARVIEAISALRDPASGRPQARGVYRREEVYHGPFTEHAADIMIEWDEAYANRDLSYQVDGRFTVAKAAPAASGEAGGSWTGTHRNQGIFIARGPHIRPGAEVSVTQYDIAPTVLHLQGQPVPADMEGKVPVEIFTESFRSAHPVRSGAARPAPNGEPERPDLDEDEVEQIEARLRDLGYLE